MGWKSSFRKKMFFISRHVVMSDIIQIIFVWIVHNYFLLCKKYITLIFAWHWPIEFQSVFSFLVVSFQQSQLNHFSSNYVLKWPLYFSGFLTNELNKCFDICLFYISMVVTVSIIWKIISNAFFSSKDGVVWKTLHCTADREQFIYLLYKEPRLSFSWVSVTGKKNQKYNDEHN